MVFDDDEINASRAQDQTVAGSVKRDAAEDRRAKKIFAGKCRQAIKAKDARAYATLLRTLRIAEGSQEWKNAWECFYSGKS